MNFSSKDYLPNSEKRIEHLREIIDGRPVAILAAGPSIKKLEEKIGELRHADICFFGFNSFVQETYILQQIGRHLSLYMNSSHQDIPPTIKHTIDFLNRNEDNILISTLPSKTFELTNNDFALNQFLGKYDRKLIFLCAPMERTVPNSDNPLHFSFGNSMQILIQMAIIGKASRIVLFGADGYCKKNIKEYYYRQGEYLPYFIPIVANYFRGQNDIEEQKQSADPSMQKCMKAYCEDIEQYKRKLIKRKIAHSYKNGSGELLPGGFSSSIFLFLNISRHVKAKLPYVWLLVFKKVSNYWKTYRWGIFKAGTVKVWHRLIKILIKPNL